MSASVQDKAAEAVDKIKAGEFKLFNLPAIIHDYVSLQKILSLTSTLKR